MPQTYEVKGGASASPVRPFIAIPAYGGIEPGFVAALWGSQIALRAAGMEADLHILSGHCHVDDSRNCLVRDFLETDCTDLVFLDADLTWNPADLIRLLMAPKDIVAGVYPLKQSGGNFPVRPLQGELWSDADGCVEVEGVPTGFLRIRRHVLESMYDAEPRKFRGQAEPACRKHIAVIFERAFEDGHRFGGDYAFCRRARAAGYTIHVIPDMGFGHIGTYVWAGQLGRHWRARHGVTEQRFWTAFDAIATAREDDDDIEALCHHWGNIPWAAGAGLVAAWIQLAREAVGPMLECGAGLTTLVAAAANRSQTIFALEHDFEWAAKVRAYADRLGLENVHVVDAPLVNGWYDIDPADLPENPALVLVDGPPRDIADRARIRTAGIDLSNALVVFDDLDQRVMEDMVSGLCAEYGGTWSRFNHITKDFAVARLGSRAAIAAE